MPTDLVHNLLPHRIPTPQTVAEYADHDRDYLLYRIEELEGDLEAICGELADATSRNRKVEDLAYRAYCMAATGRETLSREPPEPKKGRRRAKD